MRHLLKATAIALAFGGSIVATLGTINPANAQGVVVFDPGTVRYGYTDGYWDRGHAWHSWARPEDMKSYREYKGAQYYEYAHSRDANQGWLER